MEEVEGDIKKMGVEAAEVDLAKDEELGREPRDNFGRRRSTNNSSKSLGVSKRYD